MSSTFARTPLQLQPAAAKAPGSRGLRIGAPSDGFEREADRVADSVMSGGKIPQWSFAKIGSGAMRRQTAPAAPANQPAPAPQPNNYTEAAGKLGEAFLATDLGKKLKDAASQDPLVKGTEDFLSTLPGKIIAGTAAAGVVTGLAATHKSLPAQIPELPLDMIRPGLKVKIEYDGPVDHPTKAMVTFSFTPQGGKKKAAQTDAERYRAETARMADDQEKFRAGLKYAPGSAQAKDQEAEQKAISEWELRRLGSVLPGTAGRPLAPGPQAGQSSGASAAQAGAGWSFSPSATPEMDKKLELQPSTNGSGATLQRKCACEGSAGGQCDECKKKQETVQRKAAGPAEIDFAPPIVDRVLNSPGRPLDKATRDYFEPRFGYDLGKIRIHSDAQAAESARAVNALAYTVGDRIAFASGHYAPQSSAGRRLLAHELAHTIQQSGPGARSISPSALGAPRPVTASHASVQRKPDKTQEPDKSTCLTGHREGTGFQVKPPVTYGNEQIVYGIWALRKENDSFESALSRALTRWVDWRFGSAPANRRAQIKDYIVGESWIPLDNQIKPGCNSIFGLSHDLLAHATVLAGEAKQAAEPLPDEGTAPLANAVEAANSGGAPSSGREDAAKAERGEPIAHDWKVLDGNEPLAKQYLLWMQHFAGLPRTTEADTLAAGGLTEAEITKIIGDNKRYAYFTDLITQGYTEFHNDGGKDLDSFAPLIETVLQQFNWGNPTAVRNLLKIGKGDSWVADERKIVGIANRNTRVLLYDAQGAPLRSISGELFRDPGYVGAPQKGWGINIGKIDDPALRGILNALRQNIGDPMRQAETAAKALYENIHEVKPRVVKGLSQDVLNKFEDALPMFVVFIAGHGVSQLLLMSANPYLIAVGGFLKALLTAAQYVMDIDFAASALDRLLLAARYLCRVQRDDSGAFTQLSEHYMDLAAIPLRDMVSDIALLAGMHAFGRLLGAIRGNGGERPKIECHSCTVEPKSGEPKAAEAKPAEAKPAESKPGEAKAGETQPGQATSEAQKAAPAGSEPAKGETPKTDDAAARGEAAADQPAGALKDYRDIANAIRELNDQIAELVREQKKKSTPERGQAIRALRAEVKDLGRLARRVGERIPIEDEQIRNSKLSLYEKIRRVTPSAKASDLALGKARGLDGISGNKMASPSVEHIVSVKEIVNMKGFDKLSWEDQKAVVDMRENLIAMEGAANSSKGSRSWSEWPQWADFYKDPAVKNRMTALEEQLATKIQGEITRLLSSGK